MKGDFSRWEFDPFRNDCGVLQQQGRVLLDADWNAQTAITTHWQDHAARDAYGPGVAAVPADTPHAFEVLSAEPVTHGVSLTVAPGRIWVDGIMVSLAQKMSFTLPLPTASDRQALVLEVWRETENALQEPETLLEPALGGPDTTERLQTAMKAYLVPLTAHQGCNNLSQALVDDLDKLGKLTASFLPESSSGTLCPMVTAGGYSGFEHHLYRIEIACVSTTTATMFKWSQDNGGLVGRGECHLGDDTPWLLVTANTQAIRHAGLNEGYLEVVEQAPGHWRVTYGARVALDGETITVIQEYYREDRLPSGTVFFRLWNGIAKTADFAPVSDSDKPNELHEGIRLQFHPSGRYRPGDHWTFPVRVGLDNPLLLLDNSAPQGIHHHRVPLAVLQWQGDKISAINDCRRIFRPLTQQKLCCSFLVGDGRSSHGDFDSIQEAVDRLPPWGGEICLLPGVHYACVTMNTAFNVRIRGCNTRAVVLPDKAGSPIFRIRQSWYVRLEDLWLITVGGSAVEVKNSGQIEITHNIIFAWQHAVRILQGRVCVIRDNIIRMWDRPLGDVAIYLAADDGLIERNSIAVLPWRQSQDGSGTTIPTPNNDCVDVEEIEAQADTLVEWLRNILSSGMTALLPEAPYRALGGIRIAGGSVRVIVLENWIHGGDGNGITLGTGDIFPGAQSPPIPSEEAGHVINLRNGGVAGKVLMGNEVLHNVHVAFGSLDASGDILHDITEDDGSFLLNEITPGRKKVSVETPGYVIRNITRVQDETGVERLDIAVEKMVVDSASLEQLAFLYDIEITRNHITKMGLCGIGVPTQLAAKGTSSRPSPSHGGFLHQTYRFLGNPVISLCIQENRIEHCLQNPGNIFSAIGQARGLGGISLGMCENLVVRENTIASNGRDFRDPLCGIFAGYAGQADICDNHIVNNGPLKTMADLNLSDGIRGGIVLPRTRALSLADIAATGTAVEPPVTTPMGAEVVAAVRRAAGLGGYAVRVHDNLVKQPLGQALQLVALGAVSVANNQLVTDFSGSNRGKPLAGTVSIVNYGLPYSLSKQQSKMLPDGSILFCNNQVRLSYGNSWTSILLLSLDDIEYSGNYATVMDEIGLVPINTLLAALSLRAIHNRQEEPATLNFGGIHKSMDPSTLIAQARVSLFSCAGILNTTDGNQGNNCIISKCFVAANIGGENQSLMQPDVCKGLAASHLAQNLANILYLLMYKALFV